MAVKVEIKYIPASSRITEFLATYVSDICLPCSSLQLLGKQHEVQSKKNNPLLLFCPEVY